MSKPSFVKIQAIDLPLVEQFGLPRYATANSAGLDLLSTENWNLLPGERALVKTGIAIALPPRLEAQVRPRSGLALKHGVTVLNAPGTIDADYRGEIGVILINHGTKVFQIKRGDRIAQLIVAQVEHAIWNQVDGLDETNRGAGGFGSTGVAA